MAIKRKMSNGWVFKDDTMYDNFNVYEDSKAFKVNEQSLERSIKTHWIGEHKTPVVVIDNFLENVDLTKELSHKAIYSNDEIKMHASPGLRSIFKVNWRIVPVVRQHFDCWYRDILNVEYDWPEPKTTFTVIDTSEPLSAVQCHPHIDVDYKQGQGLGKRNTQLVATLLYLNKDCKGGTGKYKHKKINKHIITNKKDYNEYLRLQTEYERNNPNIDENINDKENELFELVETIEMKYNRLVMYPTCLFHHPIYSKDDFNTPDCRIILGTFV